jgi:hypothetical protein
MPPSDSEKQAEPCSDNKMLSKLLHLPLTSDLSHLASKSSVEEAAGIGPEAVRILIAAMRHARSCHSRVAGYPPTAASHSQHSTMSQSTCCRQPWLPREQVGRSGRSIPAVQSAVGPSANKGRTPAPSGMTMPDTVQRFGAEHVAIGTDIAHTSSSAGEGRDRVSNRVSQHPESAALI